MEIKNFRSRIQQIEFFTKIHSKWNVFCSVITLSVLLLLVVAGCKKPKEETPATQTGTVTDIDGNTYPTVKIGNQWWMAQNLQVTRFRNGKYIQRKTGTTVPSPDWDTLKTAACCNYYNSDKDITIGLLYNWYAINDTGNIAPAGWHVPSDEDWKTLEQNLGMTRGEADKVNWRGTHEGEKLKISSAVTTGGWSFVNGIWSTNESGFTARAGGCRMFNSSVTGSLWSQSEDLASTGFWWSSSVNSTNDQAWYRYLDCQKANVFRFYGPKTYGFSVRLVKDNN